MLPLLETEAGVQLQLGAGIESHRRRFGGWRGGFWLPECAYRPGLEEQLAHAGVRAFCVDQTRSGDDLDQLEPVLTASGAIAVPIDWRTVSLVWDERGYPADSLYRDYHRQTINGMRPWCNGGDPYDRAAAFDLARTHARRFVEHVAARLDLYRGERNRPGLCVCALDTELLGHWWFEGPVWLEAVEVEAARQGVALASLPDALDRHEPVERGLIESSWGAGKDLSTWDAPGVAELRWPAANAELELVDALRTPAPGRARGRGVARGPGVAGAAVERLGLPGAPAPGRRLPARAGFRSPACLFPGARRACSRHARLPRNGRRDRHRCAGTGRAGRVFARARAVARAFAADRALLALGAQRMRVLMLSWEYPPLIEGGLARHVRKLTENLVELGVDVHVLTRGREESPAEEIVDGIYLHRVLEPRRPAELTEFITWVEHMNTDMLAAGVELGDRFDFDLVHGHDWLVAVAGDHLAKRFDVPLAVTIHATEYGRHQGWVDKQPQSHIHGVEKWMANRAEQVITCSAYMRDHVADIYGIEEERIAVIPNGIDPSDLQVGDKQELKRLRGEFAAPDEKLVLLVGRLVYEKGFQIALEALPRIIEEVGNVRYLVAGSGTHEQQLRAQARELGLDRHGTFLGWIGDDVLHTLYRIADLTVVPSIYEPFGLVALEAMASGCPCLVADTGGLREVVPHDEVGLRFRSRDPRSLADTAIRVLADDELGKRIVAEAHEHVRSFDWADVAEQTEAVYAELAGVGQI